MKKMCMLALAAMVSALPVMAKGGEKAETEAQKAERMEWFAKAKFGVFIHWGIYAVKGVSESWSFYNSYLPYDEYMDQCKGFTAKNYDPKAWVKLIEESGARYTVITTKHHDGVALWDTQVGDISVKKSTPAGRDVLTPFVDEVRKTDMHLGLYYSLLDWSRSDYPNDTRKSTRYSSQDDPQRTSGGSTATGSRMPPHGAVRKS